MLIKLIYFILFRQQNFFLEANFNTNLIFSLFILNLSSVVAFNIVIVVAFTQMKKNKCFTGKFYLYPKMEKTNKITLKFVSWDIFLWMYKNKIYSGGNLLIFSINNLFVSFIREVFIFTFLFFHYCASFIWSGRWNANL